MVTNASQMVDVVLVHHMADGSTVSKAWILSEDQAAQVEDWLGRPQHQQLLDPDLSKAADALGERSITLGD